MVLTSRPNLSWFLTLISIILVLVIGMESNEYLLMNTQYELDELRAQFGTILEMQPEFINLDSSESQYKAANGVYKLIPYYQKLSPDLSPTDFQSSRFIIHKHIITGQWQLTEFDAYPCSKNIKAFPVMDDNEKIKFIPNRCVILLQRIQEQEMTIKNLKEQIKFKDDCLQSLTTQNKSLLNTKNTNLSDEKKKGTKAYTQLKEELCEKKDKINEMKTKFEEKLFEKENEIHVAKKKFKVQVFENEKQIVDSRAEFQKTIIKVKSEQNKMHKEKIRLMKNEMNLEQSKLKKKYWEEQETLKENLSPEKFKEKETQIIYLQNQLSKTESENNKLKMTQEILEKEKENLTNYNQNFLTQLTQEKKKCKELESTLKNNTKKQQATNYNTAAATTSTLPEKPFKTVKNKLELALQNDVKKKQTNILTKKSTLPTKFSSKTSTINFDNMLLDVISTNKEVIDAISEYNSTNLDFEETFNTMIGFLEKEYKRNENEVLQDLKEFYEDVNTMDFQIQKMKALMAEHDTQTLKIDPNYTYEFLVINYGAFIYAAEQLAEFNSDSDQMEKKMKYADPQIQKFWYRDGGKVIWFTIMTHIYLNHKTYHEDALKSMTDQTLLKQFARLTKDTQLLAEKAHQYEFILTAIGTVMHAQKELLEDFKNLKKNN